MASLSEEDGPRGGEECKGKDASWGPGAEGKEEKLGVGTGNPILPQMHRAVPPTWPRFLRDLTPRCEPVSNSRAGTVYPCVGVND